MVGIYTKIGFLDEIEDKTLSLGRYADAATEAELRGLIAAIWGLEKADKVGMLLAQG